MKKYILTISTILCIVLCAWLFIKILPFLIVGIIIIWLLTFIGNYFNKNKVKRNYTDINNKNENIDDFISNDDDINSAIDVDYKEVNK